MLLDETSVKQYTGLVRWQAHRLKTAHIEREDAESICWLALVKATKTFDSTKGNFVSYATLRMRGELLDEIRRVGLYNRYGKERPVSLSIEYLQENSHFDIEDDNPDLPDLGYEIDLGELTASLTKNERAVIYLRYYHDMTFLNIGKAMKISETRACQLHKVGLQKICSSIAA